MTDASSPPPAPGDNPLLADWTTPFRAPPFGAIRPEHFGPAFDTALARHRGEVAGIAGEAATPTFGNTIGALERSGRTLSRVSAAFFAPIATTPCSASNATSSRVSPRIGTPST
jgi:peptidyl-dipeptidase Dcp